MIVESINLLALSPLYGSALTSVHDYWKVCILLHKNSVFKEMAYINIKVFFVLDREARHAVIHGGRKELDTTERLN